VAHNIIIKGLASTGDAAIDASMCFR